MTGLISPMFSQIRRKRDEKAGWPGVKSLRHGPIFQMKASLVNRRLAGNAEIRSNGPGALIAAVTRESSAQVAEASADLP